MVLHHQPDLFTSIVHYFHEPCTIQTNTGEAAFDNYCRYDMRPLHLYVVGILCFATGAITFVAGLMFPQVYVRLTLPDDHHGSSFPHDAMKIDH